jgi:hypothetical protein
MRKQRQGVRSTKQQSNDEPRTTSITKKMHDVYIKIHNATDTMHTDQTGRFPTTSSRGNQYIMVLVEVDGNCIDAKPMKNRIEGSIIKAYLTLWARPRLVIPAGILRIPVFSSHVALFSQESRFLFLRNFLGTPSGILSVPGLLYQAYVRRNSCDLSKTTFLQKIPQENTGK